MASTALCREGVAKKSWAKGRPATVKANCARARDTVHDGPFEKYVAIGSFSNACLTTHRKDSGKGYRHKAVGALFIPRVCAAA